MVSGDRLKTIRTAKNLTQGDLEQRSGLLRNYLSRIETGHRVPSFETLEKIARALEMPFYELMYGGEEAPVLIESNEDRTLSRPVRVLTKKLIPLLARMSSNNRKLLMNLTARVVKHQRSGK